MISLERLAFDPATADEVGLIIKEVVGDQEYLQHGLTLEPGDTVFDAGANIGVFSLFAAERCNSRLQLFAFEPIPATFAYLQQNLAAYGLLGRPEVKPMQVGLTGLGGPSEALFTAYPHSPGNATQEGDKKREQMRGMMENRLALLAQENPHGLRFLEPLWRKKFEDTFHGEPVRCPMRSLSAIIAEHRVERVDFLKIDVEGGEHQVLAGLDQASWPKIRQVAIETHSEAEVGQLFERLEQAGFKSIASERVEWARQMGVEAHLVYARR